MIASSGVGVYREKVFPRMRKGRVSDIMQEGCEPDYLAVSSDSGFIVASLIKQIVLLT